MKEAPMRVHDLSLYSEACAISRWVGGGRRLSKILHIKVDTSPFQHCSKLYPDDFLKVGNIYQNIPSCPRLPQEKAK